VAAIVATASLVAAGCRAKRDLPSLDAPVILFFGDSITNGHGLPEADTFPAMIQKKLASEGLDFRCINAGVSGDTTASALARIDSYVRARPKVVVVELGANDGFRGMNRLQTARNLVKIANAFSDAGARVVVAATFFPHLLHPAYMVSLERVYRDVSAKTGADLIPDLMTGVAGVRELNLADGVHPNAQGQARLAETAWPVVRRALDASR
jgi:acyl-CoA thioesterase-1